MSMKPRARSKQVPKNKSENARLAESRGERTWTGWRLRDLVEQILRVNQKGVTEGQLRAVRSLEYLKVNLLVRSEPHHTKLRMAAPLKGVQDQYYRVDEKQAAKLTPDKLAKWRDTPLSARELDEMVCNLTGRVYYRE